jgi:hypothetical protein
MGARKSLKKPESIIIITGRNSPAFNP